MTPQARWQHVVHLAARVSQSTGTTNQESSNDGGKAKMLEQQHWLELLDGEFPSHSLEGN
jgi:hypothetical protein